MERDILFHLQPVQHLNYEADMNWPVTFNLSVNISVHLVQITEGITKHGKLELKCPPLVFVCQSIKLHLLPLY